MEKLNYSSFLIHRLPKTMKSGDHWIIENKSQSAKTIIMFGDEKLYELEPGAKIAIYYKMLKHWVAISKSPKYLQSRIKTRELIGMRAQGDERLVLWASIGEA